jgi:hypothetical protein
VAAAVMAKPYRQAVAAAMQGAGWAHMAAAA